MAFHPTGHSVYPPDDGVSSVPSSAGVLHDVNHWVGMLKKRGSSLTEADYASVPPSIVDDVRLQVQAYHRAHNLDSKVKAVIQPQQDKAAIKFEQEEQSVNIVEMATKQAVTLRERRVHAKKDALVAIDCSPKQIRSRRCSTQLRTMSMLVFFLVLAGCELDFIGFAMAFEQYWLFQGDGAVVVKAMLILMPLSFVSAIVLYTQVVVEEEAQELARPHQSAVQQRQPTLLSQTTHSQASSIGAGGALSMMTSLPQHKGEMVDMNNRMRQDQERKIEEAKMKKEAKLMVVGRKITVRYFHFLPLFRTFLVVKSINENDIEAIFRVNSLSSFTLGLAQLVGMVFTIFVAGRESPVSIMSNETDANHTLNSSMNHAMIGGFDFHKLPLVVKINIGSFLLNWFITIAYFGTPIASTLKKSVEIDALKYNLDRLMEEKNAELLASAKEDARQCALADDAPDIESASRCQSVGSRRSRDQGDRVSHLKRCLKHEIAILHGLEADLQWFTIPELMEIQKEVYRKSIEMHAT